ncbi:MAG: class I fructose-bisphosphate aldolase [Candidatus Paceibacterota bacterium]
MDIAPLQRVAQQMVEDPKGILAADESTSTAGKRLRSVGLENSEENRRLYRQLFLDTEGIENYLNGVILYTETMRQRDENGELFPKLLEKKGILSGVKLDEGTVPFPGFPGEEVTEGLDGLPARVGDYVAMGATFAKWRDVIHIGNDIPTPECIHTNAIILARYARICQEGGLVPMVEPEVLLKGDHSIERAEEVTTRVLAELFYQLARYRVDLSAVILKTSMVLPGEDHGSPADAQTVADATVRVLKATVPSDVPGVVFLSGGQEPEEATANLNAIAKQEPLSWGITFSYARALQGPALEVWNGKKENVEPARAVFLERLRLNIEADKGEYKGE